MNSSHSAMETPPSAVESLPSAVESPHGKESGVEALPPGRRRVIVVLLGLALVLGVLAGWGWLRGGTPVQSRGIDQALLGRSAGQGSQAKVRQSGPTPADQSQPTDKPLQGVSTGQARFWLVSAGQLKKFT